MNTNRPCHTRITNKNCKYFADGVHKFYLEYCCNKPCIEGQTRCKSCIKIHHGARSQFDSTYPHGHMSEPIPDHSHIFGGKWYEERIHIWGAPSAEVIAFALQHQAEARQFYTLSKADSVSDTHDMGRPKKVVENVITEETVVTEPVAPVKRSRKPKVGTIANVETVSPQVQQVVEAPQVAQVAQVDEVKPKAPPKPRKKPTKPKEAPVTLQTQNICKEVVIPTYIEEKIEEVDTQDYEVEYVILTHLEVDKVLYYHDLKKQKLYEIIKNKGIGPYIGRYCPRTETICTDVSDSDEEKDE